MRPLTLDDLMPLHEFAAQRRALFEAHMRYVNRYRRVRIGPAVTLVFENRQTLWFRAQEVLRVARLAEASRVQQELGLYNALLPGRDELHAALQLDPGEERAAWERFRGDELRLRLGGLALPAQLVTCRPEDLAIGTAHWLRFPFDEPGRRRFADRSRPAIFEISCGDYRHISEPLSPDVRQSLLDDLAASDRDAA
jgi:hypothetical protein